MIRKSNLSMRSLNLFLALVVFHSPTMAAMQETSSGIDVPEGLSSGDWSGIRRAYDAERHAAQPVDGGYLAHNPGLQWQINFDGRGFVARSTARGAKHWTWGLDLLSYGFLGQECEVAEPEAIQALGARVVYDWDELLEEWYINGTNGLEHGYTVHRRPHHLGEEGNQGPLVFRLTIRGELAPVVANDGLGVRFLNDEGAAVVTYTGLKVFDANKRALPAWIEVCSEGLCLSIDERGALYPLTIDPTAQQAYLKASNTGFEDEFGHAVAISGDTVVICAPEERSSSTGVNGAQGNLSFAAGAAYVFVRSGAEWVQQAYVKASNTDQNDSFGTSAALSGDTLVIGAPREQSSATGVNGDQSDNSYFESGAVYVFVRSGASWTQQAYLKASNSNSYHSFGYAVAIADDTIVVGAFTERSSATGVNGDENDDSLAGAGAAYVFVRSGTDWSQEAYLKASNTGIFDWFGQSVAISGDTVVVGAPREESSASGVNGDQSDNSLETAGAAYVFVRSEKGWGQQAYLKSFNPFTKAHALQGDGFGTSVAIADDTVVIGAPFEDSKAIKVNGDPADNEARNSGAAYVFVRNGDRWNRQAYLKASNAAEEHKTNVGDLFGQSVDVSGDKIIVGAISEDSNSKGANGVQNENMKNSGAAYVFVRHGASWIEKDFIKSSNPNPGDAFGISVAIAGDTAVIGASLEDSKSTGVNSAQNNNQSKDSGAVYVFEVCPADMASSEIVHLGVPSNPDAFRPGMTNGPVIGTTWDPYVDHSAFLPDAVIDILGLQNLDSMPIASSVDSPLVGHVQVGFNSPIPKSSMAANAMLNSSGIVGTLMCDQMGFRIKAFVTAGRPFAVEMPNDCSLVGTNWCAQALSVGPDGVGHLTNALQITIGSF